MRMLGQYGVPDFVRDSPQTGMYPYEYTESVLRAP